MTVEYNQLIRGGILDKHPSSLGGTATLGPVQGLNAQERVLQLLADNLSTNQVYVLSFDLKYPTSPGLSFNPPEDAPLNHIIRARIEWGSIKGQGTAILDIKHGTRLTLEGCALAVDALYEFAPYNQGANNNGPIAKIACSVGLRGVGRGPGLTYTDYTGNMAAGVGNNERLLIPSYARSVEVLDPANPAGNPSFFCTLDAGVGTIGATKRPLVQFVTPLTAPVTIPNGAESLNIDNRAGATRVACVVWHLDL